MEVALPFWRDVVGLHVSLDTVESMPRGDGNPPAQRRAVYMRWDDDPRSSFVVLDQQLDFDTPGEPAQIFQMGLHHYGFWVDDVDPILARVEDAGREDPVERFGGCGLGVVGRAARRHHPVDHRAGPRRWLRAVRPAGVTRERWLKVALVAGLLVVWCSAGSCSGSAATTTNGRGKRSPIGSTTVIGRTHPVTTSMRGRTDALKFDFRFDARARRAPRRVRRAGQVLHERPGRAVPDGLLHEARVEVPGVRAPRRTLARRETRRRERREVDGGRATRRSRRRRGGHSPGRAGGRSRRDRWRRARSARRGAAPRMGRSSSLTGRSPTRTSRNVASARPGLTSSPSENS